MVELNLPYEFTIENLPLIADRFVELVQHHEGVQLDYTVPSVTYVDDLIGSWRGPEAVRPSTVLALAGIYTGECMRRDVKGHSTS